LFFTLLFNLLYGGISDAASMIIKAFPKSDSVYIVSDLLCSMAYLLSYALPVSLFYALSKNAKRHPMNLQLKMPEHKTLKKYVAVLLSGLAVVTATAVVNSLIFPVSFSSDAQSAVGSFDYSKSYVVFLEFIASAIVPAFAEELLFRGLIVSNIKPYNKTAAVVVSALAFGLMHQNPRQLFFATAAGLILGVVYLATESIWCCIAIHFVNNFISVFQTYAQQIFGLDIAYLIIFFLDVFIIILGTIGGLWLLKNQKESRLAARDITDGIYGRFDSAALNNDNNNGMEYLKKAFLNPAFAVYVAICAILTAFSALLYW
jgi:membrane protease YdiL (CAAX protease family)